MYKVTQLERYLSLIEVPKEEIDYIIDQGVPREIDNDGIVSVSKKIRARDPEIRIKREGEKHTLIIEAEDEAIASYEIDVKIPPRNDAFHERLK